MQLPGEGVPDMEILCIALLVILGCLFPALMADVLKMSPEDANYREKRYGMCACFGAILFLLVLILN